MTLIQKTLITVTGGLGVGLFAAAVFYSIADYDKTAPTEQQGETTLTDTQSSVERDVPPVSSGPVQSQKPVAEKEASATSTQEDESSSQRNQAQEFTADMASQQQQPPIDYSENVDALGLTDSKTPAVATTNAVLTQYESATDPAKKLELRTVLASSDDRQVEQYALSKLVSETDPTAIKDWLALLAQKGIHETPTRQTVLKMIPSLTDPQDQRYAITAMEPSVVSPGHREEVVREIANHSHSGDERVRGAAIEMIGRWGDPSYAYVIENALFDSAPSVRSAALFAAFTSTVRTDEIKSSLMRIMDSDDESWDFRMDAYSALSAYQLTAQEFEKLYQFDQDKQAFLGSK